MCTHKLKSCIYFEFVYYDSITVNRENWLVSHWIRALVVEGYEHYIKGINGQGQLDFTRSQNT